MNHAIMRLELDTIHEYQGLFGPGATCRIRIYRGGEGETPVVVATDLPGSEGTAINNVAEQLAAEVLVEYLRDRLKEAEPFIWIEHFPAEPTGASPGEDRFSQVTFANYRTLRFKGRWRIGPASWRYIGAGDVADLLGAPLST
ncbi:hypothetical protein EPN44_03425 [bacterium]|nr:MAG: hypothetical protein EPN44_03425 [bacterium]